MSSVIDLATTRAQRDARYCEGQAEDIRAKAQIMKNGQVRSAMLRVAAVWDTLARRTRQDALYAAPSYLKKSASSLRARCAIPLLSTSSGWFSICEQLLLEPFPLLIA
jgi:hypothetical protein